MNSPLTDDTIYYVTTLKDSSNKSANGGDEKEDASKTEGGTTPRSPLPAKQRKGSKSTYTNRRPGKSRIVDFTRTLVHLLVHHELPEMGSTEEDLDVDIDTITTFGLIPFEDLEVVRQVGAGSFSTVYEASIYPPNLH
jgi:hypothetical protein